MILNPIAVEAAIQSLLLRVNERIQQRNDDLSNGELRQEKVTVRKTDEAISSPKSSWIVWNYDSESKEKCDAGYTGIEEGTLEVAIFCSKDSDRVPVLNHFLSIVSPEGKIFSGVSAGILFHHIYVDDSSRIRGSKSGHNTPDIPGILYSLRIRISNV